MLKGVTIINIQCTKNIVQKCTNRVVIFALVFYFKPAHGPILRRLDCNFPLDWAKMCEDVENAVCLTDFRY